MSLSFLWENTDKPLTAGNALAAMLTGSREYPLTMENVLKNQVAQTLPPPTMQFNSDALMLPGMKSKRWWEQY